MKAIYQKIFLATIVFLALFVGAQAADGDLDTSFGTGGKVTVDFNGNPTPGEADQDSGLDVTVQPDGKIIVVGESYITATDTVMSATRLNANGTIDTTFATNGRFMQNVAVGISERAYGVAIQADGKILIAGRTNSPRQRVVIRLNSDGSLDTTFGTGGIFQTPIGSPTFDEPEIAIQADGKVIVIGATRNGVTTDAFSVMRLNTNGTLDTTFDGDGEAVTVFQANDRAYGVKLQADGKIVVSGSTNNNGAMALARYKTDGGLDETFDTDGKVTTSFPSSTALAYNLAIQPNGKIIAAGYARTLHTDAALVRYNTDGSLDTTFGNNGSTTFGTTSNEIFWDIHLKGDKIIGTGNRTLVSPAGPDDFMMVRYNGNGTIDSNFGTSGVIYTDFNNTRDLGLTSAVQPDGKIVIAGYSTPVATFNPDFAAARYNFSTPDAPVDFNGDGKTDFAILRPSANAPGAQYTWWINYNGTESFTAQPLGLRAIDIPVPADYDGDGRDDIAVFRFQNTGTNQDAGNWYIIESSTNTVRIERFGIAGDNPTIVDDYDGDGKDDLAVFRVNTAAQGPGQAYFFYRGSSNNPNGNITYVPWGMRYGTQADQVDDPYTGDFDGDGKADFGVQRRADISVASSNTPAVFYLLTATGNVSQQYFGWMSDRVVPGDYDGDGKTDICVVRGFNVSPSQIIWYIRYSGGAADEAVPFGQGSNFNFAQGDYDGDGKTDIAFFVAGQGTFWWRSSADSNNIKAHRWGNAGGIPADLAVAAYNNR
jgi:uncharacterized delta-60 repeat protein